MDKILLVEDDTKITEMICLFLRDEYDIVCAYSGTEGLLILDKQPFDLVILDIMLPGKSGDKVLTEIRKKSNIPILILTAITDKKTTVDLLEKGANDYLTKPFDLKELRARLRLRINPLLHTKEDSCITYKNLVFDRNTFQTSINGQDLDLSRKELQILRLFLENPNRVFSKEQIYQHVWGDNYIGDENTVNVHISSVRKKIQKADEEHTYLETVWGIGIKLAK